MIKLAHKICSAVSGAGSPPTMAPIIIQISDELQDSKYTIKRMMLSRMRRPSLIAKTIDVKSSSMRTISAASLVKSVPVMPIATPTSA